VAEWWHILVPVVGPIWSAHDVISAGAVPQATTTPPSGYQPPEPAPGPAAPETPTEMYTWTPAEQEARARAAWEEWRRRAIPDLPGSPEPWQPPRLDDLTLGAVIVAGAAVVLLLWRTKRR